MEKEIKNFTNKNNIYNSFKEFMEKSSILWSFNNKSKSKF